MDLPPCRIARSLATSELRRAETIFVSYAAKSSSRGLANVTPWYRFVLEAVGGCNDCRYVTGLSKSRRFAAVLAADEFFEFADKDRGRLFVNGAAGDTGVARGTEMGLFGLSGIGRALWALPSLPSSSTALSRFMVDLVNSNYSVRTFVLPRSTLCITRRREKQLFLVG